MDRGKCRSTYFGFCDEDDVEITCLVKRTLRSFAKYGCAEQLNLPMGRTRVHVQGIAHVLFHVPWATSHRIHKWAPFLSRATTGSGVRLFISPPRRVSSCFGFCDPEVSINVG